jgi:hypothetical protein
MTLNEYDALHNLMGGAMELSEIKMVYGPWMTKDLKEKGWIDIEVGTVHISQDGINAYNKERYASNDKI